MLPPEDRLVGAQLHRYIRDELYWVLHAPRQTGKTTFLQSWMREINAGNEALACYVSVERCQELTEIERAMPALCEAIRVYAQRENLPVPELTTIEPASMLDNILGNWAVLIAPKPLVVLFDEVDVLHGEAMISFLRQLRGGFATRGAGKFPTSIALVGMRDLKDYITKSKDSIAPNPGSPFNIKEDSAVISNFSKENIVHLFAQRTEETGQKITDEALEYVWEQAKGQPWLVNSLFKRATMRILDEDSNETVTIDHIKQARQQIILARETHLDSLAYRLDDAGVKKIIELLISGEANTDLADTEAFQKALDMGLVVVEHSTPQVANPIYREVLARQMTYSTQLAIQGLEWKWEKDDGSLDMDRLLKEFQKFWRRHSEVWEERSKYTEAFPHLLLMAFLQRVLNGGGNIEREYAAGRGRMDLLVEYKEFKYIIEIKLIHYYESEQIVREEGLEQIVKYRDKMGASIPSYLLIFDRRNADKKKPWEERLTWETVDGITVIGV
ncbi:MAG: PD-(D/E)XK nuclease domain-containing protein [Bacteroidales bacterium]|jgi:hypothetical protein|nr:PD-(D/E)XK nuclease domain-containing protein [Bacteroidales bacterium]